MAAISINIRDHGVIIDQEKNRVKCNYCEKIVGGFFRLKCHLGGIRGDVKPCVKVPKPVQEKMKNLVVGKQTEMTKTNNLQREKRARSPNLSNSTEQRRIKSVPKVHLESSYDLKLGLAREKWLTNFASTSNDRTNIKTNDHSEAEIDASAMEAQRCIARFFYEQNIDIGAARSRCFQEMLNAIVVRPRIVREIIPTCEELRGNLFEKELDAMTLYVHKLQNSWLQTGCSILLDPWVTENGQYLMTILVDCPEGTMYLRSCDISAYVGNACAMQRLINQVVEEVGQSNVVQIITDSVEASCMLEVEKLSESNDNTIFWSLSASYCLELILKEIEQLDHVQEALEQAKTMTRAFHSDATIFKLMKDHTEGCPNLVSTSKFKFAKPFLTLQNIFSKKGNLERMLESPEWVSLATTLEKQVVAILIENDTFWDCIEKVWKATKPIVEVLHSINSAATPQIAYIYELMDEAKEQIWEAFENEEAEYEQHWKYWDLIDDVWDNCLHSPLHAAAFRLNPSLYFSEEDSRIDFEVESGFQNCLARMVQDPYIQEDIYQQLNLDHPTSSDSFRHASENAKSADDSPAQLWSYLGEQCPQWQKFAKRILSQTCDGASRYGLNRSKAENLLTTGSKNIIQQQRLSDLAFVHYNLHLKNFDANRGGVVTNTGEVDPIDDWIVENPSLNW